MPSPLEIPSTGNELLDELRGLQIMADGILEPDRKLAYVRQVLSLLPIDELLGRECYIDSSLVIAKSPEQDPNKRIMINEGLQFLGRSVSYDYSRGYEAVVDFLTLDFSEPEIVKSEQPEIESLEAHIFQVPVLAFDTFAAA